MTRAGSADATLTSLALGGVTLSPGFVSRTTVTASEGELNASVEITPVDSDDATDWLQVALVVGTTVISVVVTTQDGITTRTYIVTVKPKGGT